MDLKHLVGQPALDLVDEQPSEKPRLTLSHSSGACAELHDAQTKLIEMLRGMNDAEKARGDRAEADAAVARQALDLTLRLEDLDCHHKRGEACNCGEVEAEMMSRYQDLRQQFLLGSAGNAVLEQIERAELRAQQLLQQLEAIGRSQGELLHVAVHARAELVGVLRGLIDLNDEDLSETVDQQTETLAALTSAFADGARTQLELPSADLCEFAFGICSRCGCTEDFACGDGCSWANSTCTLCSNCVETRAAEVSRA